MVGDPVIKKSRIGIILVGLSPATFVCLSQARTWISNVICRGLFLVQWVELRWEVIVRLVDVNLNNWYIMLDSPSMWYFSAKSILKNKSSIVYIYYLYWCPTRFLYQIVSVAFSSNKTVVTSGAGTTYPSRAPEFCILLFVLLSFYFWPLCCLSIVLWVTSIPPPFLLVFVYCSISSFL